HLHANNAPAPGHLERLGVLHLDVDRRRRERVAVAAVVLEEEGEVGVLVDAFKGDARRDVLEILRQRNIGARRGYPDKAQSEREQEWTGHDGTPFVAGQKSRSNHGHDTPGTVVNTTFPGRAS